MSSETQTAKQMMKSVPQLMRWLRRQVREVGKNDLTIAQYRVLAHLDAGAELTSELAELQAVSLPAMSNTVDTLARRELIERVPGVTDRRHIRLRLTPSGRKLFNRVKAGVEERLSAKLTEMDPKARERLVELLKELDDLFG